MKLASLVTAILLLFVSPAAPQGSLPQVGQAIGTGVCLSNTGTFEAFGTGVAGDPLGLFGCNYPTGQFARLIMGDVYGLHHIPYTSGWLCMDSNTMIGWDVRAVWGTGCIGWGLMDPPGVAGETWTFQVWYRHPYGGSGFSQAVELTFQ